MKTKTQVAHAKRVLGVGLAIVLVAAVFVSLLQTNFGSVSIKQLEIVTDEGNKIAAMMYLPKGVSKETLPRVFLPYTAETHHDMRLAISLKNFPDVAMWSSPSTNQVTRNQTVAKTPSLARKPR